MRNISLGIALAAALLLGLGGIALADEPNSPASCAGLGSSVVGQLGTRDDVAHRTKDFAASLGVAPGALVSMTAQEHAGSFFGCFGFVP